MKTPIITAVSSIRLAPSPAKPVIGPTKIRATKETLKTTVITATTNDAIRLGKSLPGDISSRTAFPNDSA
jgi:hypothetical protein